MTQPTPQLYTLTPTGPRRLPVPTGTADFIDLGVYSEIRAFHHNRFFQLDHHLDRTVNSMRLLGWDYHLDEARLRRAIHELCTAYPALDRCVRIDILAVTASARGSDSRELIVLMPFTPPPTSLYKAGVALGYASGLH